MPEVAPRSLHESAFMPAMVVTPAPRSRRATETSLSVARDPSELTGFLPAKNDPDYLWILSELISDDLHQHWTGGHRRRLRDYRETFPELFQNQTILQPIADQEYQLRKSAGESPNPLEYRDEYGIEPPSGCDIAKKTPAPIATATIMQAVSPLRPHHETETDHKPSHAFDEYESVPGEAFPKIGDIFQGFVLRDVLGRGTFAQVYLAEQIGLASRPVALKVTRKLGREANRLARLQHANIVPIFSFHASKNWQAICMPYFGRQTLDQIVRSVRKSLPKSGQEMFSTVAACADRTVATTHSQADGTSSVKPSEAASRGELRDVLSQLSYVDAAVLIAAQIADGLVHAHSLNILHLDLKPANVLLSDHGQPMLLDFNLAFDREREERTRFGGTIPYMAPEQLVEMMRSRERQAQGLSWEAPRENLVDGRTDLFAVGVMLFELLTGQLPFPHSPEGIDPYAHGLESRKGRLPSVRAINPAVPAEIDAVIRKLLDPTMANRYPNAAALREDLLNYLEHRPLSHVRSGGPIARFRKWRKRNPTALAKLMVAASVATALAWGAWGIRNAEARERVVALQRVATTQTELNRLRIDLAANPDSPTSRRGIERARQLFTDYGIGLGNNPQTVETVMRLPTENRERFLGDLRDIATLAAFSEGVRGTDRQTETHVKNWLILAEQCSNEPPAGTARAAFLEGVRALHDGRMGDANKELAEAVRQDPTHGAAQFLLGMTFLDQYQYARASERFEMAAALDPGDARASYNRGLIFLHQRKPVAAENAFNEALRRDPTMGEAYLNRAMARVSNGKLQDALTDCQMAREYGGVNYRSLSLKADIHGQLNDQAARNKTLDELSKTPPKTSSDYLIRGITSAKAKDYTSALLDFRTATTLNPRFAHAWNNQAHVLGEKLHETDQAIAAMDRAVDANPQNGELYMGRAVLHARTGHRTAAHADVEKSLLLTEQPITVYQAACAYSLTSQTHPADADRAVDLLRKAIRDGYRDLNVLTTDTDLQPIRSRDDVRRLLDAVGSLTQ